MTSYQLADLFELVVDQVPDREALVAAEQRLTYRELDERANRVANHLLGLALPPGAAIGIDAWNRAEWLEVMIGAYKARLVPININYRYVAEELAYLCANADLDAIAYERAFEPLIEAAARSAPSLRHFIVLEDGNEVTAISAAASYEAILAGASPERPAMARSNDDHYVLYTGGTTGMPKGVIWRHEDIYFAALGGGGRQGQGPVRSIEDVVDRIWPEDGVITMLALPPLMHGAAQWVAFNILFGGGKLVLNTARTFDAFEVWRTVERERCSAISLVGDAMARPLADALDTMDGIDVSSLFSIGSGGAIFSRSVKEQIRQHLPSIIITDGFGSSETGANSLQIDPDQGMRFPSNETTTVLGDDLRPVEVGSGVVGRLAHRGHVPLGYHKDEVKTAATFITDADGVRWAIPGDHATLDADGLITLLGRGSQCINSGGEKIYPEEVEEALKSHPDVFDALVVGLPDERFGEKVAAVVEPRAGRSVDRDALVEHCRSHIAGYKVPRRVELVDTIGRTASGKADYGWAKRQLATGVTAC